MKRISIILLLVFIAGCHFFRKPASPYKGFSTIDGITYLKYCDIDTSHKKPTPGSVIEAMISYSKLNDSVFWSSHDKGFPYSVFLTYNTLAGGSTYERQLLKSAEGDSITYIVPADSVFQHVLQLPLPFFLHAGTMMKVNVRVVRIMDSAQYIARNKALREYRKDMDMQEQLNLLHYVTFNNIPDSAKHENVYIIPSIPGAGQGIVKGSQVSIAYKGYFLNGHPFDSIPVSSPLQFKYGDTAQMIRGLEIAIKMMREGEKAKIIIPSQLAFGENGSSTGIVPPYTTLIYEVTILKVK